MPILNIFGDTAISTIGFLLVLSFLVIIHELGHLLTAIWMKVKVEEFGIGYPPKAKTLFHWKGIPFTLNWLPFGGFVRMQGEDGPEADDSTQTSDVSKDSTHRKNREVHQAGFAPFYEKSKRARLVVLLAGVFINFLFGIIAFSIVYTVTGFPRYIDSKIIEQVLPNSPAEQVGIQVNDSVEAAQELDSADSTKVSFETTTDVVLYVNDHLDQNIRFFVKHDGQEKVIDVYLRPVDQRPEGEGALGIAFAPPEVTYDFYPWWQMPFRGTWVGIQESIALSLQILMSFKTMITQLAFHAEVPKDVAGPFGIVHQAAKFGLFQNGWAVILKFTGMLSVNLAILNFLPIPALDGGRAFFVIAESFIGRKRREMIEGKVNYAGFAFLLGLIVLISIKDIWSIFVDIFGYFKG